MKKFALFALVTSVAVLPALSGAVAQTRSDTATEGHTKSSVQRQGGHVAGTEAMIPSNELIGAKVENSEGKDLGKVDRLLVDANTGRIAHVVIRTGGFAGIKAKHVMVPWSEVKTAMQQDRNRVVLRMDQATLDKAPAWEPRQAKREGSSSASPRTERERSSSGQGSSTYGSGTSR